MNVYDNLLRWSAEKRIVVLEPTTLKLNRSQSLMSLEILAYEETSLGLLCLRRRELLSNPGVLVTEVTLNHEFLMSSYLTESERALSYFGLDRCRGVDGKRKLTAMVAGLKTV